MFVTEKGNTMIEIVSPPEAHYTVYKLTGPTGRIYIGQTGEKPEVRWGKGYQRNSPMGRATREYGMEAFKKEILCEKLTREGADKLEKWFVEYYDSTDPEKGYNSFTGGARLNAKMNEASKERLILYHSQPANAKKNQSAIKRTYEARPELRELVRQQMKKRSADGLNRAFLEGSRKAKPVMCIETGEVFPSQRAAKRMTGFAGINQACSGIHTASGGYHWKWISQRAADKALGQAHKASRVKE